MAASKHTPGPHTVEQIGRRPLMSAVAATVLTPSRQRLADFRHVADANLFAAAPEMFEALKAFRFHYPMGVNPFLDEAYRVAVAAIAAVETENP